MAIGPWELAILLFVCGVPLLLGIVFVAILVARTRSSPSDANPARSPLDILQERYARGEIDSAEYEERRARIQQDPE